MDENLELYYLAAVPVLGVTAQWLAWKLRLPSILLLLLFGILLGEALVHETGSREVIPQSLLFPLVTLSVGVILFEGGLTLKLKELKESGIAVISLVTVGVAVSWLAIAASVHWMLGFPLRLAAVLGAVLVVTGPTVVAPLLRLIRPSKRVAATVKWEGIVIDPVGAVLAVLTFEVIQQSNASEFLLGAVAGVAWTAVIGAGVGLLGALFLITAVHRYWLPDYLHSPVFLGSALLGFTLSNQLQHESGLLAVTVMGIVLANQRHAPVRHVIEFKENLQVLLIGTLFIVLGSRVDPRSVLEIGTAGLAFLFTLIFVIRPLSVMIATWRTGLTGRERVFLSFLAPRGIVAAAVASVFALELAELAHIAGSIPEAERSAAHWTWLAWAPYAEQFVSVTFLVIVATVAFYGFLARPLARMLGLSDTDPQGFLIAGADPWVRELALVLQAEGRPVILVDTSFSRIAAARMAGLTGHCGSILSDVVQDSLDLAGIGNLLAATPNEEVNTLAAREFMHQFGRRNVFQLRPRPSNEGHRREAIAEHLRARLLFSEGLNHDELTRQFEEGTRIKRTKLTSEFTFEQFQELYGREAAVLAVIDSNGKLQMVTEDQPLEPQAETVLLALVREPQPARQEPAEQEPAKQEPEA